MLHRVDAGIFTAYMIWWPNCAAMDAENSLLYQLPPLASIRSGAHFTPVFSRVPQKVSEPRLANRNQSMWKFLCVTREGTRPHWP